MHDKILCDKMSVHRFWMTKLDAGLITPLPASDSGSAAAWGSKRINPWPQSCLCLTWSGYPSNNDNDETLKKLILIYCPAFQIKSNNLFR